MAKIYGINGAMTGKLGNTVMAIRYGEQIARQYQPVVANPSTSAQVAARAKLKLMSQLSAVMAPYIAMRRVGAVSSRNMFVKKNFGAATYANNNADIEMSAIQLTNSNVIIPQLTTARGTSGITAELSNGVATIDRMVYVLLTRDADNKLNAVASQVISDPGANNHFSTTLPNVLTEAFVYGYGIRFNGETARVRFGNMNLVSADDVARLITSGSLIDSDVTLTVTRYSNVAAPL